MQKEFTDQMGRTISIEWPPKRIVSLVPSQTELLFDLGLDAEVVGITKFCVHPEQWFRSKRRVGGTKKLDFTKIAELKPDLIIGNKEENEEAQIKQLMEQYPVWMSDIHNLHEALGMIKELGAIVNRTQKTDVLIDNIEVNFSQLKAGKKLKVLYFIWKNPYMAVGTDTFINDMLSRCGLENLAGNNSRYPELTGEEIAKLSPDVILLSSEPFPFADKHIDEFKALCPNAKILLADGEYFSWYGSRLLGAPKYFQNLLAER